MDPGIEVRILSSAFDKALELLPRFAADRELPGDCEAMARRILLVLLEPNEVHEHGDAVSGYDEQRHRVFIAYYCASGQLPHPSFALLAFLHELGHIFLEMDEEDAGELTLRAGRELGLEASLSAERRKDRYQEGKRVWNEGRFPYLAVLRGEMGPEEARARIREMSERGFDLSV